MKENRISDNLDILLTMFERSKIGELQKFSGHVRDFLTNEVERTIKSAKTTLYLNDKKIYAHFAPYTETKWSERIRIDENGDKKMMFDMFSCDDPQKVYISKSLFLTKENGIFQTREGNQEKTYTFKIKGQKIAQFREKTDEKTK